MTNLSPAAAAVLDAAKTKYELERDNFYKWLESCPIPYHIVPPCNTKMVICEFHYSSIPPHYVAAELDNS